MMNCYVIDTPPYPRYIRQYAYLNRFAMAFEAS